MDLTGKTAAIIGGGGGIGRALVLALVRAGARVFIGDIRPDALSDTIAAACEIGAGQSGVICDLADDQSVASFSDQAFAALGRIDFLFNHAGVSLVGPPDQISSEDWAWLLNVNIIGLGRSVANFLPRMSAQGSGWIINTSSGLGLFHDLPLAAPYIASKAAIIAYSRALAVYSMNLGVRVSVFAPEITNTDFLKTARVKGLPPALLASGLPLARMQTAEEAAATLIGGLAQEQFLISATHGTQQKLRSMAKHMLAPSSDLIDAHGRRERVSQLASLRVPEEQLGEATELIANFATRTQAHHGCIAYEVARDISRPATFRIFEIWTDQSALDAHVSAPETLGFLATLFGLGACDFSITPL